MKIKSILFLGLLLIILTTKAQDTTSYFMNKHGIRTNNKEEADKVRNVVKVSLTEWQVKDYYINGKLQATSTYLTEKLFKKTGKSISYFQNGQIASTQHFIDGKEDGQSISYYENGAIKSSIDYLDGKKHGKLNTFRENWTKKREDIYSDGKFVNGKCFNSAGKEIEHFEYIVFPEFPEGEHRLFSFLGENVNYDKTAIENNIQGTVYIGFVVNKNGDIESIHLVRGVNSLLDNEALRVISLMPKWTPGKIDGEKVAMTFNLPIKFSLQ